MGLKRETKEVIIISCDGEGFCHAIVSFVDNKIESIAERLLWAGWISIPDSDGKETYYCPECKHKLYTKIYNAKRKELENVDKYHKNI